MDARTFPGVLVRLRAAGRDDVARLAQIRATPEVYRRWGGDMVGAVTAELADPDTQVFVIVHEDRIAGAVQWSEEDDPDYRTRASTSRAPSSRTPAA